MLNVYESKEASVSPQMSITQFQHLLIYALLSFIYK